MTGKVNRIAQSVRRSADGFFYIIGATQRYPHPVTNFIDLRFLDGSAQTVGIHR